MTTIRINSDSCIKCGKCTKVCPANIFEQEEKGYPITICKPEICIVCGHCLDVCPTGSIKHSEISADKVHPINYENMPSADQLMELIHARRSNRTMKGAPVPTDKLEKIVEAGRYAPTARNTRQVTITVINDPEKLKQVQEFTINTFGDMVKKLENPFVKLFMKATHPEYYDFIPAFYGMKKAYENGKDPILRNSSAIIAFTTPTDDFGEKDSNLAYQNASLMAQALGVSQVYLGFVSTAYAKGNQKRIKEILGVEGDIHALMGLGIPTMRYTNYTER
ncbi:nitroreductase family protein [Segatella bryantii]|uniref:nitroreductase family protein n=1 Tax=Segatella bryantii TaxID=77095 RepID=UPI00242D1A7A|nr:nitroreductase family protein [Segatella bryantii]